MPNPSKRYPQIAWHVGVTPWSIDDRKWFERRPHQPTGETHLRNESLCHDRQCEYLSSCDRVAVQQLEATAATALRTSRR